MQLRHDTAARWGIMADIFISYSHKDEPDPGLYPDKERWLTFVKSHLGPAIAHHQLEVWDDRRIEGGADWRAEIEFALNRCAVCVFLISRHSLSSRFILDVEMKWMLERHHAQRAHIYPIIITSCDLGAADWLMKLNLRPPDGTALERYDDAQRNKVMADLVKEIREFLIVFLVHQRPVRRKPLSDRTVSPPALASGWMNWTLSTPIRDMPRAISTRPVRMLARENLCEFV